VRLRLDLAYDGTDFFGWAIQPALRTVQGDLERALATVLRTDAVRTTCAGRTDTGVHARCQVVHVDLDLDAESIPSLVRRLNGLLNADVRVLAGLQVPPAFNARFSALWRRYCYRIADHPNAIDPLLRRHVLTWSRPLDIDRMNQAAQSLLGVHDFAAYCKRRDGATTIRELQELSWMRDSGGRLSATVRADAFCHNMVRSLVGALIMIGEGTRPVDWAAEVLAAKVRSSWVNVAPARGLTLEQVAYPEEALFAAQAEATRRVRT